MIDVEIKSHADGVGRHQIVDFAGLVERDLGVARARRQRAQHDRGAAALTADQFRNGVNFICREGDDRGTAWQSRQLLLTSEAQLRQPRPADDADTWQQPFDNRPHRGCAEYQRLLAPAPVQDAVGEDMAALKVGGELDFVDGKERHIEVGRHRLDGRDPEARIGRFDFFLAGHERDRIRADPLNRLVVNFARQQPQRQANQAGRMRQHSLDGEMGLAGISRTEHSGDAGAARAQITIDGRRK